MMARSILQFPNMVQQYGATLTDGYPKLRGSCALVGDLSFSVAQRN